MQTGYMRKLQGRLNDPVQYALCLAEDASAVSDRVFPLNMYLGKTVTLHFSGHIACCYCSRVVKKTYQQGYCFPCSQRLARCDLCILRPEKCHFHQGTCREPEWGKQHCFQPHIVYIAKTAGLKVGITRQSQVPTRWIDQGAVAALPLFQVPDRRVSGQVEVFLAQFISDRTAWRAMLKGDVTQEAILTRAHVLVEHAERDLLGQMEKETGTQVLRLPLCASSIVHIHYPVSHWPTKIVSLNPVKTPHITGTLLGIKGQYLLLDSGVINMRKYTGHKVSFCVR